MRTTVIEGSNQKPCGRCKEVKLLSEFGNHKNKPLGKKNYCKLCVKADYQKDKDKIKAKNYDNRVYRAAYSKKYYAENLDACKAYDKRRHVENQEKRNLASRIYHDKNRETINLRHKNHIKINADLYKAKSKKYIKENPHKISANLARYRARRKHACPPWYNLVKADIQAIYAECRRMTETTGIPHHVDHEIPLQHKLVCGLHVPANLRVITATENLEKHNKFTPYVESDLVALQCTHTI